MKPFMVFRAVLFFLYCITIVLIIFPGGTKGKIYYRPTDNPLITSEDLHYCISRNKRYFYYDYEGTASFISDMHIPGAPEVIFSSYRNEEVTILKSLKALNNFLCIDFQKMLVICYNKVSIKFYDYDNFFYLAKNYNYLNIVNPGEYTIINNQIFSGK